MLLLFHELINFVFVHHHLFVRVLTGVGVLDGFDDFDEVAAGAGVGRTLAGTGVLGNFSHNAIDLVPLDNEGRPG